MIDQQDQDLYETMGSAFTDVRFAGDGTADVLRRGRALRRRRRAMPAAAAAGVLGVSLGLAAVGQSQSHASPGAEVVNVDEAAFSVHTNARTDVVTVTIRQLVNDESELKHLLAEAGVSAVFHEETVSMGTAVGPGMGCKWTGASVLDPDKVLSIQPDRKAAAVFEIDRGAMPRGSVVALSYTTLSAQGGVAARGVSTTLLSTMPTGCV